MKEGIYDTDVGVNSADWPLTTVTPRLTPRRARPCFISGRRLGPRLRHYRVEALDERARLSQCRRPLPQRLSPFRFGQDHSPDHVSRATVPAAFNALVMNFPLAASLYVADGAIASDNVLAEGGPFLPFGRTTMVFYAICIRSNAAMPKRHSAKRKMASASFPLGIALFRERALPLRSILRKGLLLN